MTTKILVSFIVVILILTGCNFKKQVIANWQEANLDVSHYRNGDTIIEARTNEEWAACNSKGQGCWCHLFNDSNNRRKYGKLYNWYAVKDARGLAPEGWHIPSKEEWSKLVKNLGGEPAAGKKMKNLNGWFNAKKCTNEAYFYGMPGGSRQQFGEESWSNDGFWWSATEANNESAWVLKLSDNEDGAQVFKLSKTTGCSVRCFKD